MRENMIYRDQNDEQLSDYEVAHWESYSNCGPETAELFFANKSDTKRIEAAKRLCAACKVAEICLSVARNDGEKYGIWGGKTEEERGHKATKWNDTPKKPSGEEEMPSIEEVVLPTLDDVAGVTFTVGKEEYKLLTEDDIWQMQYDQLDPEVTANEITTLINRKSTWIRAKGKEFGIEPHPKFIEKTGRYRNVYPKELAMLLYEMILEVPIAGDWKTANAIAKEIGQTRPWVVGQLAAAGIVPEERRSATNGVLMHYPPSSIEVLQDILVNVMPPAGDWLTVGKIAGEIGKDAHWVQLRINAKYTSLGELRRNDINKPYIHYPPYMIDLMRIQVAQEAELPMAGDFLALYTICALVGHTEKWVTPRLKFLGFTPESRINPTTRQILNYYPPEIVDALLALPNDILTQTFRQTS